MGVEEVMKIVVEKLKEALLALENLGGGALAWFDKVFPPETMADKINHWFHVALPYLITAVVLTVVVRIGRSCCRGRGGGRVKMMEAPGRNYYMMPRSVFEGDTKCYFLNLRAYPGDQLC